MENTNENTNEKIINQTIERNKILGVVYSFNGIEYCDWLQPSEISTNIFDDENIKILLLIIQNNKSKTNILPTKKIIEKLKSI